MGVYGFLIRLWTMSRYAHVELWFPSGERCAVYPKTGVTVYRGDALGHDPSAWDLLEVRSTITARNNIGEFVRKTKGQPYDWRGIILSQVLGGRGEDKDRWFCSEHVMAALQCANREGGYTCPVPPVRAPSGVSPGKLYKLLTYTRAPRYRLSSSYIAYAAAVIVAAVALVLALLISYP
jgi:hypothetical protein